MRELLHVFVGWLRSKAGVVWQTLHPHSDPGVVRCAVADAARSRRELVLENAILRQQIIILRRKVPRPMLWTEFVCLPARRCSQTGVGRWQSCNQRRSSGGTAKGSARSGVCDPEPGTWIAGWRPRPSP